MSFICLCRTTDGHCRVLSLRQSLYLPKEQEGGVCAQHGEVANAIKDGALIFHTWLFTHACVPHTSASPCNWEKNKSTPSCYMQLHNYTLKKSLLLSVWGLKVLSALKQDIYFLNFATSLDITKNCRLKVIFKEQNMSMNFSTNLRRHISLFSTVKVHPLAVLIFTVYNIW